MTRPPFLLVDDGGPYPVRTLPGRVMIGPSPRARYWHIPRSAREYTGPQAHRRLCVQAWCGQSLTDPTFADDPTDGGPVCGTCAGRAMGTGASPGFAFAPKPTRWLPERWCPGDRRRFYWNPSGATVRAEAGLDDRHAWCLFCGQYVRLYHRDFTDIVRHEHRGRGMACPDHGWDWLRIDDHGWPYCIGHSVEGLGDGSYVGPCRRRPMPFWVMHA